MGAKGRKGIRMATELAQGSSSNTVRMQSIDIVRAMAIVFVILGHTLIYAKCGEFLVGLLYSFHMSLLFILSGFVAAASWERSGAADCRSALRKISRSARRLLVPYSVCGIIVMPIVNFLLTEDLSVAFLGGWRKAFLNNRFLWYLPCNFFLVCIFVAVALSVRGTRGRRWLVGVVAAFVFVVAARMVFPHVDYIRSVMNYFPAFFAGAWLWPHRESVLNPSRKLLVCSSAAFIALAVLFVTLQPTPYVDKNILKPFAGLASFVPLMAIARKMKGLLASGVAYVGRATLFLYCFDFSATPITVWYFTSVGVLPAFAIAFGIVATGLFVNLSWEYAILPELKRTKDRIAEQTR